MRTYRALGIFFAIALTGGVALAEDGSDWTFAIGTGLQFLNAEGDVGLTALGDARYGDLDLSPDDFADMMDSMFGFNAYAENDRWKISVIYGTLTLKDDATFELRGPLRNPLEARVKQDITFAEGTVEYRFAQTGKHTWGVLGGVRYTEHKYKFSFDLGDRGVVRKLKDDWTDALIGLTHSYPFSDKVVWDNRVAAGIGDSDSFYELNTAVKWQFARHWKTQIYMDYRKIDFENDNPGDPDWYLYDVDEFGPGIGIEYVF